MQIIKTAANTDTTNLQKRMRKLWSLILIIRRNEAVLRDLYEKRESKPVPLKSTKTAPILKTYESGKVCTVLLSYDYIYFEIEYYILIFNSFSDDCRLRED